MLSRLSTIPSRAVEDPDLSHAALRILAWLGAQVENDEGWTAASFNDVARALAIDRSTAIRSFARLEERGYVQVLEDAPPNPNRYRIRFDLPPVSLNGHGGVGATRMGAPAPPPHGGARATTDTALPDDFPGEDEIRRARAAYPSLDLAATAANFRRYYASTGCLRANWQAAWARWLKTAYKDRIHAPGPHQGPLDGGGVDRSDAVAALARAAAERARRDAGGAGPR